MECVRNNTNVLPILRLHHGQQQHRGQQGAAVGAAAGVGKAGEEAAAATTHAQTLNTVVCDKTVASATIITLSQ